MRRFRITRRIFSGRFLMRWRSSAGSGMGVRYPHRAQSPPIPGEDMRPRAYPISALAVGATPTLGHRASLFGTTDAKYSRRNLPHFERPWAKYIGTLFPRADITKLTSPERATLCSRAILYGHEHRQYQLYAGCVMPDHVHLLFEPQIKEQDKEGKPVFWALSEILQGIKSASAHQYQ